MVDFTKAFAAVNNVLVNTKSLWQIVAFVHLDIPWQLEYPVLYQFVSQLSNEDIDNIDANHQRLIELLLPKLNQDLGNNAFDKTLFDARPDFVSRIEKKQIATDIGRISSGIKGRKWEQITQFSNAALKEGEAPNSYLEWCAGKGHLGRLIGKFYKSEVVSLEWQQQLCELGEIQAKKHGINQMFVHGDAFECDSKLFKPQQHALALHACGDLHVELLKQGAKAETKKLTISPCCYHLIRDEQYQPLSQPAKSSELIFSKFDLRLPLQHSLIANEKHNQLRNREVHWRLSFDALQRDLLGSQKYLPLPTVKQSQLSGTFEHFCYWAFDVKNIIYNEEVEFEKYLTIGAQRHRTSKQIDLVRHVFRYVLEMWLAYDRALFLEQHGYKVSINTFCDMSVTPRNLIIDAKKCK
ncbi:methyltransferase [Shewanella sp. 202IG2-18]|uniref:methyltransferase n=1 Tax=Parashewanella hymeniacidonis TaxID=2807618 RepID=UPI00196207F4|nr:methyltransferase [Parashewanella hymeniacidonis]MBM7072510.1 methyltransferase [Parashewanella hymeniacidonis]